MKSDDPKIDHGKVENVDKSIIDCLNILVNDLRHLQYKLNPKLQNKLFMQNHLIIVCENMAPCQLACYKYNFTLIDQIVDLHSSITLYKKFHRLFETKNFFIDRRYRDMEKFQLKQLSFRVQIFYRSFKSRPSDRKKKKCFVCEKKNVDSRIILIKRKIKRSCNIKIN